MRAYLQSDFLAGLVNEAADRVLFHKTNQCSGADCRCNSCLLNASIVNGLRVREERESKRSVPVSLPSSHPLVFLEAWGIATLKTGFAIAFCSISIALPVLLIPNQPRKSYFGYFQAPENPIRSNLGNQTRNDELTTNEKKPRIQAEPEFVVTADLVQLGIVETEEPNNFEFSVDAGTNVNIRLPGNSASFITSIFNPTGLKLTTDWNQISGPEGGVVSDFSTISLSPTNAITTVKLAKVGTYLLRYSARAENGKSAFDDVSVTLDIAPQIFGLNFRAEAGVISPPFAVNGGVVSQPIETGLDNGGRAAYSFTIANAGNYLVVMRVNSPTEAKNSVFLDIDSEPQDPTMIWNIPITSGTESRTASWQGAGIASVPEFVPKAFTLSAGTHQLIIRGREADVEIDSISIVEQIDPPTNLRVFSN